MLYRTVNNAIITLGDTDVSGRGRHFKSRFIQPGIAGYPGQFGNVLITKETFDKFINTMVGVPVIINHKDLNKDNADDERVGVVSNVWFDEKDGWYWCEGVIWDETAQNLITEQGWSVSCSYEVLKADDEGGSENNISYDMEFLDGVFTHLALVDNPRYERANIVFNSKINFSNQFIDVFYQALEEVLYSNSVNNGWVTLKYKLDEDGKPLVVFIPGWIPQGGAAFDFHEKITKEKFNGNVAYEFERTRADISISQKDFLKNRVNNILDTFQVKPPLKGLNVCSIGGGCLGVAILSQDTRTLSLDSSIFKENGMKNFNKSVETGWLTRTDTDVLTSVLTHELGHIITAGSDKKDFWNRIKEIKSEYLNNIGENDIQNKDYISKYARTNKDEFVAECFAQATLLKNPSKYAKMVLDEINTHFKLNNKEAKQLRLFNAMMGILNMNCKNNITNNKDNNKDFEITWIEGNGIGYCLTEEDYEKRKNEVEQHTKEEMKK